MSLSLKIAWNTGVQIFGRVLKLGINIVMVYFLTRILGPDGMGRYETIFTYLAFFELIADMGLNTIITKWVARDEKRGTEIISNILGIRLVLSTVMMVLIFASLPFFPQHAMEEKYGIMLASISSLTLLFNAVMVGIFQVKLKLEKQVIGDLVGGLLTFLLIVLIWVFKGNLLMVVGARVLGNILWFLITLYFGRRYFKFSFKFNKQIWKEIWAETFTLGLAILFWRVYYKADILLLRFLPIPVSLESNETIVGIYSLAYKIFDLIVSLPGMFMVATFPILAKYSFSDRPRFLRIYQKSFYLLAMFAFPMLVSVVLLAPKLILTFADERFLGAIYLLQILAFAAFLSFFNSLNNGAIVSLNKHKQLLLVNLVGVIFNICLNLWVIPRYSNIGAAYATVFTELIVFLTSFYILKTTISLKKNWVVLSQVFFASLVMGNCLYFTLSSNLIINLLVAFVSFFGVLFVIAPKLIKNLILDLPLTDRRP